MSLEDVDYCVFLDDDLKCNYKNVIVERKLNTFCKNVWIPTKTLELKQNEQKMKKCFSWIVEKITTQKIVLDF